MEQKEDLPQNWRKNFNFAYSLATMHQRAITVPIRRFYGTQALGFPCLFALGLMVLWYVCTADPGMLAWIVVWLLFLVARRIEAVRLAGKVHSHYDGFPVNLGTDEFKAKRIYEPIGVGVLGGILFWIYTSNGLRPTGLPFFFLAGIVTLPFIETVKRTIWERKIQGMQDARMEQEMLTKDFENRG